MTTAAIDTTIPEFLKVANRDKPRKGAKKTKTAAKVTKEEQQVSAAPPSTLIELSVLEGLKPETRAYVEQEMKQGRFRLHWLRDNGTLDMILETERAEEKRRAEVEASKEANKQRLRDMAAERKAAGLRPGNKPPFGTHTRIVILAKANPRVKGTKVFDRWEKLMAWVKENPTGSTAQAMAATGYRIDDFAFDEKRGHIKADVYDPSAPKEAPPALAAALGPIAAASPAAKTKKTKAKK